MHEVDSWSYFTVLTKAYFITVKRKHCNFFSGILSNTNDTFWSKQLSSYANQSMVIKNVNKSIFTLRFFKISQINGHNGEAF